MKEKQKTELIALVEKGWQTSQSKVLYCSACAIVFIHQEKRGVLYTDWWGLALTGKFGTPADAYKKFKELYDSLPKFDHACFQSMYAVAQLLNLDWKELLAINCERKDYGDHFEKDNKEIKRVLGLTDLHDWEVRVTVGSVAKYEKLLAMTPVR